MENFTAELEKYNELNAKINNLANERIGIIANWEKIATKIWEAAGCPGADTTTQELQFQEVHIPHAPDDGLGDPHLVFSIYDTYEFSKGSTFHVYFVEMTDPEKAITKRQKAQDKREREKLEHERDQLEKQLESVNQKLAN